MPHHCPSCGSSFETHRGLGVHHNKIHGESLPNRQCDNCDTRYYAPYQKKYCSDDCRQEAVTFENSANPNYNGEKTTTTCEICGSAFDYYPSNKEGVYCPDCVETEKWQSPPNIEGDRNPRWIGGRQDFECVMCGTTVERYPSDVPGEVILCSTTCRREWLSESFTGEGHPNWKGGGNEPYGEGWNEIRNRALGRDGYACAICSADESDIGRNPDVHHIIPVRAYIQSTRHNKKDAHRLANVITLCPSCHRKAEYGNISKPRLQFLTGEESS